MRQSRQRQGIVVAAAVVALLASFAVPSDSYAIGGGKAAKEAPWPYRSTTTGQGTAHPLARTDPPKGSVVTE
ncbi:hypothetical protein [Streptomyces capitiformicae]|uniref:Uncharacterized protein n=1 Tax=Streptomyces capitiformicae TaxID=2014920 RepID=A0A919DBC5_9ACTN|nr:hypothetical protein [Streptomyces capitiformicae]GHE27975.1 hypothetical protein GCM10017771_43000 [Streptomyces capitiformicae]